MSETVFITCMAILVPALFAVLFLVAGMIADEFREDHKCVGLTMIAAVAVIVAAALPWYLL